MAPRKKKTPDEQQRSRDLGRELADRINEGRARRGLPPDPRLEVALHKTWREMTPEERVAERARYDETTRALEERVAYWQARVARQAHA